MNERRIPLPTGAVAEIMEGGEGPELVFLAGAAGLAWNQLLVDLAERYHVTGIRLPGTGGAIGDDDIVTIHDLVFYLLDVLDALGLEEVLLLGHSVGAMIAAELAAAQPKRFRRLALIGPLGLWNDAYRNEDFFPYRLMLPELMRRLLHDPAAIPPPPPNAPRLPPPDRETQERARLEMERSLAAAAKYLWPIPDRGLRKRAHRITAPTLLLWGRDDRIVSIQYAADWEALLPDCRTHSFDRCGHAPQIEHREEAMAVIHAFFLGEGGER